MKKYLLITLILAFWLSACGSQPNPANGQNLATLNGCTACHSTDGTKKIGPTWQGLYNSTVTLDGGSTIMADETYLTESIASPSAKIVEGYSVGAMPEFNFTEEEIADIVAYIKSLAP